MAKKSSGARVKAPAKKETSVAGWNKWLTLVFAVEGLSIILFSAAHAYPVTVSYLGVDTLQSQAQGQTVMATGSQVIFNLSLAWVIGVALILVAIMHGMLASRWQKQYDNELKSNTNMFRWVEYAVTTSLLVAAVSLAVGIQDIAVLLMAMLATALFSILSLVTERLSRDGKPNWWLFWLACAAGLLPWIAIKANVIGGTFYGSVPAYVYWLEIVAFLLFACVPANLFMQLRKSGNWKEYKYSERWYLITSLATKTVIAWLIFAAILRP